MIHIGIYVRLDLVQEIGSLLRDVTFDMDPMADRNHWKRRGKGIQGRVAVPFTGKLAGE